MEEVSIASSATSDTSEVRVNSALKDILLFVGEESCPACAHLPARNGLVNKVKFLGLIIKNGKDQ